ncbi:MAG: hypothetical protein K0M67_16820 [Thiobacillus sp.]|nr:hypothetical protein [Hydrogenophaga sp.]MBW8469930.1 hypothetical protein [Thiobacillus sp.]
MQQMPMHRVMVPIPCIDVRPLRQTTRDEQFLNMLDGFRLTGGLIRGHDLTALLSRRCGLAVGTLARWIEEGEVVHMDWQQETWLPMFQFYGPVMALHAGVRPVLKELCDVLEPWEIAQWFAFESSSLGCRTPADAMSLHQDQVLHAARCHRFALDG